MGTATCTINAKLSKEPEVFIEKMAKIILSLLPEDAIYRGSVFYLGSVMLKFEHPVFENDSTIIVTYKRRIYKVNPDVHGNDSKVADFITNLEIYSRDGNKVI